MQDEIGVPHSRSGIPLLLCEIQYSNFGQIFSLRKTTIIKFLKFRTLKRGPGTFFHE